MNGGSRVKLERFQPPKGVSYDLAQLKAAELVHANGLGSFRKLIDILSQLSDTRRVAGYVATVIRDREAAARKAENGR